MYEEMKKSREDRWEDSNHAKLGKDRLYFLSTLDFEVTAFCSDSVNINHSLYLISDVKCCEVGFVFIENIW